VGRHDSADPLQATDGGAASLVEAAVDDVRVTRN
jgi:hypothetical protein